MRATMLKTIAATCVLLSALISAQGTPQLAPVGDARLQKLPVALREEGRLILAEADEDRRADLAQAMARRNAVEALDFLLALLDTDPSADVREHIVERLENVSDPRVDPALERRVLVDPDPDLVLVSLELLRGRRTWPLMRLLERRLDSEKKSGTPESIGALMAEQERWTTLVRGGLLPTFFQVPPAAFTLKAAGQPVRVLAFGDYGDGGEPQKRVAAAMLRQHQVRPFDFAITLGDNFYPAGMDSPSDARWDTWWSALYDPLKIHFYVSMGNHDWNQSNSPAAEILFSQRSPSWRLPSAYYTFHAGPVQFFALDTDIMSQAQLQWLASALDSSRAAWKVVYGHHPVYSAGQHGDSAQKIRDLLPVIRDRADVYIAGHDHDMQHLRPEGRVHFFVAGSGGKIRPIQPGPRSLFARSANGFAVIDADERALTVSFVETDLSSPYSYTITRSGTSSGQTASPAPPRR